MAIILRYFAEFCGQLRKSGWLAIKQILSREMSESTSTRPKHDGRAVLFAVAEVLVIVIIVIIIISSIILIKYDLLTG